MRVDNLVIITNSLEFEFDEEVRRSVENLALRNRAKGVTRIVLCTMGSLFHGPLDVHEVTRRALSALSKTNGIVDNCGVYVVFHWEKLLADEVLYATGLADQICDLGLGHARKIVLLGCYSAFIAPLANGEESSFVLNVGRRLAQRGCTTMIAGWDAVVSVIGPDPDVKISRSERLDARGYRGAESYLGRKFVKYPNSFEGAGWRQGRNALPSPAFRKAKKLAYRVTRAGVVPIDVDEDWHDVV